jgi:hypothetical protein
VGLVGCVLVLLCAFGARADGLRHFYFLGVWCDEDDARCDAGDDL